MQKKSRWTVAEARAALHEVAASGLTVSAYAVREGLDAERFYRWRRRLGVGRKRQRATAPTTPALIELRPVARRAEPVEIVLPSGVTLRVAEAIDPAALARLVAALR